MAHLSRLSLFILIIAAVAGVVPVVQAQESLLWKATNKMVPVVVPPYDGEPSPFPTRVEVKPVSDTTGIDEEMARLRNAAREQAETLISSGRGVEPYLGGIRVGGTVEGVQGRRVLVANRWLGVGTKFPVRVTKSSAAVEAIRTLTAYDATAGAELSQRLDAQISANPTLEMTLREINKDSLVFDSRSGRKTVNYRTR